MTAALETVRNIFRKKETDRQSQLDALAGRLIDGENIDAPKLEKLIDSLGATGDEFEATVTRIDAERKREAERARLQSMADQFETIRAELRGIAAEGEQHKIDTEAHAKEMKRAGREIAEREAACRERLQAASSAREALARGKF
jgi:hypothetical protein